MIWATEIVSRKSVASTILAEIVRRSPVPVRTVFSRKVAGAESVAMA